MLAQQPEGRRRGDDPPDYTATDAPGREGMFYGVVLTRRGSLAVVSEAVNGALGRN